MATPAPPNSTDHTTQGASNRMQLHAKPPPQSTQQKKQSHRRLESSKSIMSKVVITIPSLVSLRRTLQRWRSRASSSSFSDAAAAVPAGHVAVSVQGAAPRRFLVRVAHLSHPAFLELLRQAEEEYGFPAAPGPVALPCDEDSFLDVLHRVSSSASSSTSCCCDPVAARSGRDDDARPLLQGIDVEKLVW